jgi:predicted outer membrane repeat protein
MLGHAATENTAFTISSGPDIDFAFADLASLNATSAAGGQTWLTATGHANTAFAASITTTPIAVIYPACNFIATTKRSATLSLHSTSSNVAALRGGAINSATKSTAPRRMEPMPDMSQTLPS